MVPRVRRLERGKRGTGSSNIILMSSIDKYVSSSEIMIDEGDRSLAIPAIGSFDPPKDQNGQRSENRAPMDDYRRGAMFIPRMLLAK